MGLLASIEYGVSVFGAHNNLLSFCLPSLSRCQSVISLSVLSSLYTFLCLSVCLSLHSPSLPLPPDPPSIPGTCPQPEARTVTEGDDITLNCTVKGNPPPSVVWMFGNQTITDGGQFDITSMFRLGFRFDELAISEVTLENIGVYTCAASGVNNGQMVSYSYFLDVQG